MTVYQNPYVTKNYIDSSKEPKNLVDPSIASVVTPSVVINGGASSGSKHIDDSTPTVAETLTEQIHWTFTSAQNVRAIRVRLYNEQPVVTAISSTAAAVISAFEARNFKISINPGDDTTGATNLTNGTGIARVFSDDGWTTFYSDTAITDVYGIASLSDVSSPLQGRARVYLQGISDV